MTRSWSLCAQVMTPEIFVTWIDAAFEDAKDVLAFNLKDNSGVPAETSPPGLDHAAIQGQKIYHKLSELVKSKSIEDGDVKKVAISSMSLKLLEKAADERLSKELKVRVSSLSNVESVLNDIL